MVEKIPEPVLTLLQGLRKAGYEAYPVGGCVRDLLRGELPRDWDVASSATPEQMERVFADYRVIETGLRHGTITVLAGDYPVEITAFRTEENYSDGRHPDAVRFGVSLSEDLARRDFTIGAMALDWHADKLIDCFGGTEDLAHGVIRAVGSPTRRFDEDALRILRGLRFASVLGFTIEPATAEAMRRCREGLRRVSPERIRVELQKLICGRDAARVLRENVEIIGVILPELCPMIGFDQHNPHHNRDVWEHTLTALENIPPEPVLRWIALYHDSGKPENFTQDARGIGHFREHPAISARITEAALQRLRCENKLIKDVTDVVRIHDIRFPAEKKLVVRWSGRWGREVFLRFLEMRRADTLAQAEPEGADAYHDEMLRLLAQAEAEQACFNVSGLKIKGGDLARMGFLGPEIGETLAALVDEVQEGRAANEREALLDCAARLRKRPAEDS